MLLKVIDEKDEKHKDLINIEQKIEIISQN